MARRLFWSIALGSTRASGGKRTVTSRRRLCMRNGREWEDLLSILSFGLPPEEPQADSKGHVIVQCLSIRDGLLRKSLEIVLDDGVRAISN